MIATVAPFYIAETLPRIDPMVSAFPVSALTNVFPKTTITTGLTSSISRLSYHPQ